MVAIRRVDRITQKSKQKQIYSDFTRNFEVEPNTGSLIKLINEDSVKNSLGNLIQTIVGERFYQNEVGSFIRNILFEPVDDITSTKLQSYIESTIRNFEPRAINIKVIVTPVPLKEFYDVEVFFHTINSTQPTSVSVLINRIR